MCHFLIFAERLLFHTHHDKFQQCMIWICLSYLFSQSSTHNVSLLKFTFKCLASLCLAIVYKNTVKLHTSFYEI